MNPIGSSLILLEKLSLWIGQASALRIPNMYVTEMWTTATSVPKHETFVLFYQ